MVIFFVVADFLMSLSSSPVITGYFFICDLLFFAVLVWGVLAMVQAVAFLVRDFLRSLLCWWQRHGVSRHVTITSR